MYTQINFGTWKMEIKLKCVEQRWSLRCWRRYYKYMPPIILLISIFYKNDVFFFFFSVLSFLTLFFLFRRFLFSCLPAFFVQSFFKLFSVDLPLLVICIWLGFLRNFGSRIGNQLYINEECRRRVNEDAKRQRNMLKQMMRKRETKS